MGRIREGTQPTILCLLNLFLKYPKHITFYLTYVRVYKSLCALYKYYIQYINVILFICSLVLVWPHNIHIKFGWDTNNNLV